VVREILVTAKVAVPSDAPARVCRAVRDAVISTTTIDFRYNGKGQRASVPWFIRNWE